MQGLPVRQRTILVTGAFGQVGSELVPALRKRFGEERVVASDLRMMPPGTPAAAGLHEHLDCTDCQQLLEIVRRHDVGTIYHLAALLSATAEAKPQVGWSLNMGSLYNVLEVARQYHCRVFFPSSIGAFGADRRRAMPRRRSPSSDRRRCTGSQGRRRAVVRLLRDRFGVDTRGVRLPGLISQRGAAGRRHDRLRGRNLPPGARATSTTPAFSRHDTRLDMMYMPDAIPRYRADGGRPC